jgi:acetolactate synthase-1/2/3 large subunit
MKMKGAELIIRLLERQGIEIITGIPGGANLPLYHALAKSPIRHVLARHEQGAAFMAQGMARSTGKAAVCLVTSGPGVTNIITPIADAKLDSVPLVVICGQVPTALLGKDSFQEIDTYTLTRSICKKNYLVKDAHDLLKVIPEAFAIAQSGRQGPVVIDVPKDVQLAQVEFANWPEPGRKTNNISYDLSKIQAIAEAVNSARRPLLYTGGGIIASGAHRELLELARKNSLPLVSTLMGLGGFPASDPLFLGMLGMHGSQATNHLLDEIDLLIALGVRFDDRATGQVEEFCPQARIIHIDIDEKEINKIKRADLWLVGDLKEILKILLPLMERQRRRNWQAEVQGIRYSHPPLPVSKEDGLHPLNLLRELGDLLPADTIITTDVGQHQMWTAQAYPFRFPRTLLTSGGLGTMGFGLPAAMGAALANPKKRVLCCSGDGSLYMNIQELVTLAELNLKVTIILFNNRGLGLVRQQQELFYDKVYTACRFQYEQDFIALAASFGIRGIRVERGEDWSDALEQAFSNQGPCLIELPIKEEFNVYPMVPPGKANREMLVGEDVTWKTARPVKTKQGVLVGQRRARAGNSLRQC